MVAPAKTALIMAGGTGGHVFPALAVATTLQAQGVNVHWLGTRSGLEAKVVPAAGFDMSFIKIKGLRGKGSLSWLLAPFKVFIAIIEALQVCLKVKPQIVLGMGGFVTGPGGVACRMLGKPLVVHEQNAIPGMTNKLLSKIAMRILCAFPNVFVAPGRVFHTGNPVRESILNIPKPAQRYTERTGPIRILVVGGSLGAQVFNEVVPHALASLAPELSYEVWHQTGKQKLTPTIENYKRQQITAKIVEFIDNMDEAYAWADVVICRAGAMTVAELSNVGLASILVPYPYAVDDHQTANAKYLSDSKAAILIQQVELTSKRLAKELTEMMSAGREYLLKMALQALEMGKPDATEQVVQHCLEVAHG